ncbi:MAG: cytochrome P450 [Cyanobacteriota bacterium]|nr:cytochrome P450 [Cyanobacteriota bacterium]
MKQLPAGPTTNPTLQMFQWVTNPLGYMETNQKRFGEVFTARFGPQFELVFFSHPEAIREILSADARTFDSGRANGILLPLVGDNSLLLLDGERHKQERKLLMPPFHGDRMKTYATLIQEITRGVMERWPTDKPFSVRSATQEVTMRVILNAVFGLSDGLRYESVRQLMTTVLDMTGSPLGSSLLFFRGLQRDFGSWSPWGRFLRRKAQLDELLFAEIRERRENLDESRTDILTLLLLARDEEGNAMSDRELRDELLTLLLAGHETTATALAWALYWIHKLPEVRSKLRKELAELGENPDPMEIVKAPYLNAVCQETLRIYPVALITFPRVVKSSLSVMGHHFGPETSLAPCVYLTHHRPELYPDSKQFKPERFLERQYSPYEFYAFGGGHRRCLGQALAIYEMKLALAKIVSEVDLVLPDDRPIEPVRRGVTLAPSGRLQLMVKS